MSDDLEALDAWCKARAARLTEKAGAHILAGKGTNAPAYRTLLGEHRAYMAMRSFIHGSRASVLSSPAKEPME